MEKNSTMWRKIEKNVIQSEDFNMKEIRRYKVLVLIYYHQDSEKMLSRVSRSPILYIERNGGKTVYLMNQLSNKKYHSQFFIFDYCNISTWPAVVNTANVVDRYIDKIRVIPEISSCPQLHPAEDNINKVIIGISPWTVDGLNSAMVADASAHRSGLGQVANGEQTT